MPFRFDDADGLSRALAGADALFNTYWVRFPYGGRSFERAIANSGLLFDAARRAGVGHIVHVSVSNADRSPLPYYRGKAAVERALAASGVPYAIVRPTLLFGGARDLLLNNIAFLLRRLPLFAVPGDGAYRVRPVHVDDVATLAVDARPGDVVDAAGPEAFTYLELVRGLRDAVRSRAALVRVPPGLALALLAPVGVVLRDVVLTREELAGLMTGLLYVERATANRSFRDYLERDGPRLGARYLHELERHFR